MTNEKLVELLRQAQALCTHVVARKGGSFGSMAEVVEHAEKVLPLIDAALEERQNTAKEVTWDTVCRGAMAKTSGLGYFCLIMVGIKLDPDDSDSVITDITNGVAPEMSEASRIDLTRFAANKLMEQVEAKSAALSTGKEGCDDAE